MLETKLGSYARAANALNYGVILQIPLLFTRSYYIPKAGIKLVILLRLSQCKEYRCEPPGRAASLRSIIVLGMGYLRTSFLVLEPPLQRP